MLLGHLLFTSLLQQFVPWLYGVVILWDTVFLQITSLCDYMWKWSLNIVNTYSGNKYIYQLFLCLYGLLQSLHKVFVSLCLLLIFIVSFLSPYLSC